MDDSRIVDLYLQRDESALSHTADKYGSRLRTLSYRIVADYPTAEECENDTYIQAWNSIPPHEPRNYLYAFLARIIRHISLNFCRHRDRLKRSAHIVELSAEMEACIPAPNDYECSVDDIVLKDAINSFLSRLDAEKRNIFIRRYWYLDSIEEICKRFALSESKVKVLLFRCRNKLRQQLIKEGYTL
ncbi:MAG: RNA polymerase sigma factor [Oscillospiraceae bacterium]|nr:RNA polymerase sigma factor [Oscillospiraceae bacterium]